MKRWLKKVDKRWKELALAGCVCVLFYVCITHLSGIFSALNSFLGLFKPVFIGAIIAYVVYPLAALLRDRVFSRIRQEKLRWVISVALTVIFVIALLGMLLAMLIPQVFSSVASLVENFSSYVANLKAQASAWNSPVADMLTDFLDSYAGEDGLLLKLGTLATDNMSQLLAATTQVGGAAVNWTVGAIIAVYLLLAKDSMQSAFKRLAALTVKPLANYRAKIVLEKFHGIFTKYIVCEVLDALLVGVLNFLFMVITGMPDALFISVVAGVTNLAPTFGPIAGAAIGGFVLLLLKPAAVLPFLIFTVVLQTADGYLIKPRLFGGALNVPGVLILIAIIVFGRLWGVAGMLVAIPIAAILAYLYSEVLLPWLELRKDLREYYQEINEDNAAEKSEK